MSGRLFYWVANWNLARAQAVVLLGHDAVEMVDCTSSELETLLAAKPAVKRFAGYVTGSPDIKWTSTQIDQVRELGHGLLLIDQSNSSAPLRADIKLAKDVESGASLISTSVEVAKARLADGLDSTIYIEQSELAELENAVELAHLPRGEVVAYQYASPSHTPHTLVPGTGKTIAELNCDLSVVRPEWLPLPASHAAASGPLRVVKVIPVDLGRGGPRTLVVTFESAPTPEDPDAWRVQDANLVTGG